MMRLVVIVAVLSSVGARAAEADCAKSPPIQAQVDVYECSDLGPVDPTALESDGRPVGLLLRASVSWPGGASEDTALWVSTTAKLDCTKLAAGTHVTALVEKVCCDAATSTACRAGAQAIMTNAKPAPAKPVKKATRAQLEAEVEKLRAENARLHADLLRMRRAQEADIERLRAEQKKLGAKVR
jgi:hypothetical protein